MDFEMKEDIFFLEKKIAQNGRVVYDCMKHFIKGCYAINRNVRISVSFCDDRSSGIGQLVGAEIIFLSNSAIDFV